MSRWERRGVSRTHADSAEEGYDVLGSGSISTGYAYELTEDEERALRKERRRAEQRRKPLGFAPWPEDRREA